MIGSGARFPFVVRDPAVGSVSLSPMLPITLDAGRAITAQGLLDTGATVNVLPYDLGVQLGFGWDQQTTAVRLAGNLASVEARGVIVSATVAKFPPVRLAFAWAMQREIPLILGQMNFFVEFDVCFFRSRSLFEVRPKGRP